MDNSKTYTTSFTRTVESCLSRTETVIMQVTCAVMWYGLSSPSKQLSLVNYTQSYQLFPHYRQCEAHVHKLLASTSAILSLIYCSCWVSVLLQQPNCIAALREALHLACLTLGTSKEKFTLILSHTKMVQSRLFCIFKTYSIPALKTNQQQ